MLNITKAPVPPLLADYVKHPEATWDGPSTDNYSFSQVKEEIRASLFREQHGLCAYCMCRIRNDSTSIIEHFFPRSKCVNSKKSLKLDYSNLLLCCNSEKCLGTERQSLTCDRSKADTILLRVPNPSSGADVQSFISYKPDGTLVPPPDWDVEINSVLNLNDTLLKYNRKIVRAGFIKNYMNRLKPNSLHDVYHALASQNPAMPYLGIVLFTLRQKMQQN